MDHLHKLKINSNSMSLNNSIKIINLLPNFFAHFRFQTVNKSENGEPQPILFLSHFFEATLWLTSDSFREILIQLHK